MNKSMSFLITTYIVLVRYITDTICSMEDTEIMYREIINPSEQTNNNNSKVVILERVADFFYKNNDIGKSYTEPYAAIIDFDPYLALEILKLGEDMPISRDAYAKGVADGVAAIIEMFTKQDTSKMIPVQKALGTTALMPKDNQESN